MKSNEQKLRRFINREIKSVIKESTRSNKRSLASLIFEAEDSPVDWESNYESFVKALAGNAGDQKIQAFIAAGKLDKDENDDKFTFGGADLPVAGLIPTQNEIDVDKSLAWPMKKPATFLDYLKGAGQSFTLGSPIVTYKGKYVIDGHHRWSQLYACNKDAKIKAIDISVEGLDPLDVLKAVQAAIAVQTKSVPMASVEGVNLLKIDKGGLESWFDSKVDSKLFDAVKADEKAMEILGGGDDVKKAVTEFIWGNVEDMQSKSQPVDGAPKRDFMPQTDNVDWQKPLEQGLVDVVGPHADPEDVKKSVQAAGYNRGGTVMVERWQRLAGLIK